MTIKSLLPVALLLGACHGTHVEPVKVPPAGVSIAMYGTGGGGAAGAGSFGVVDDRRWIDVTDNQLWLEDIDPGAALPSLVIEALSGPPLELGACVRERMPTGAAGATGGAIEVVTAERSVTPAQVALVQAQAQLAQARLAQARAIAMAGRATAPPPELPTTPAAASSFAPDVHCTITGVPGRRLVRVLYVSSTLSYRAQSDLAMTAPTAAHLATRFAIQTPQWRARAGAPVTADVTLYDGVPGGDKAPEQIANGRVVIDGSTAVVAPTPRDVPARLRRVYDGAVSSDVTTASSDAQWNAGSQPSVWVWLELPGTKLPPGPVLVHVDLPDEGLHDMVVGDAQRELDEVASGSGSAAVPETLRLQVWQDDELHGSRQRVPVGGGGGRLTERAILAVANMGDRAREVWIEERMRPARKRTIDHAWPTKPALHGDVLRTKVSIKPGDFGRTTYVVDYTF
jgi:hypothetical protein|nr:hypothetical protein [Kofleriaceae bacterium]